MNLLPTGLPPGTSASAGGFTADPKSQRLFGELGIQVMQPPPNPSTTTTQVLTISPSANTVTTSGDLTQQLQSSLAYDSTTNSLFGITKCCPNELVRIDPVSGIETPVAALAGDTFSSMAIDEATHTLYVESSITTGFPSPPTQLLSVDTTKTDAVSTTGVLALGGRGLIFDPAVRTLFGVTFCCFDSFLVTIDPSKGGAETTKAEITGTMLSGSTATLDPATHTVYVINSTDGVSTFITSINDQSGTITSGAATPDFLGQLVFLPATPITPASIQADVQKAVADGSIKTKALADSLLDKLARAAEARADGNCKAAARIYEAFIDQVTRQSGKKIAIATATQLVSEAQFLIANCP